MLDIPKPDSAVELCDYNKIGNGSKLRLLELQGSSEALQTHSMARSKCMCTTLQKKF